MWSRISLWTLIHCAIIDMFINTVQFLWLWVLMTYRSSSNATRIFTNFGTSISVKHYVNLTLLWTWALNNMHRSVPEHSYQDDNAFMCPVVLYEWLTCIVIQSAASINHLKVSINTKYISAVDYTYHCMVLTWWYPTKQNLISVHSVFHLSMSEWGSGETGNYTHIFPLPKLHVLPKI